MSAVASRDMLAAAVARLAAAGVSSPRADVNLLAEHATGIPAWRMHLGCEVDPLAAGRFEALVIARIARIPTQHLTGTAHFRHLALAVGPGVFVPRPETELLVDLVAQHLSARRTGGRGHVVADLCSGSGAIAISVATEVRGTHVVGIEADAVALAWAQRNAAGHIAQVSAAGSTLAIIGGDATVAAAPHGGLWHLRGGVDVVVTNPPYIPDAAVPREPEVRDHDPARALYGGPDGLDVVRALIGQAGLLLRPGGLLLIEHAESQGDDAGPLGVPGLLRAGHWGHVADHRDLAGRPRHTAAVWVGAGESPA
jgi:release factor glutamine methyltransferase